MDRQKLLVSASWFTSLFPIDLMKSDEFEKKCAYSSFDLMAGQVNSLISILCVDWSSVFLFNGVTQLTQVI